MGSALPSGALCWGRGGRGRRAELGLFRVWEREEIHREAGCQVCARPSGWPEGQVWPCPEAQGLALLQPEPCNWCSEERNRVGPAGWGCRLPAPGPCPLASPGRAGLLRASQPARLGPITADLTSRPHPSAGALPQRESRRGSPAQRPQPDLPRQRRRKHTQTQPWEQPRAATHSALPPKSRLVCREAGAPLQRAGSLLRWWWGWGSLDASREEPLVRLY